MGQDKQPKIGFMNWVRVYQAAMLCRRHYGATQVTRKGQLRNTKTGRTPQLHDIVPALNNAV
jgi:hypothetical protein